MKKNSMEKREVNIQSDNLESESREIQYTVEDLQKARQELEGWREKFANARGSNPNKFRSQIRDAVRRVREIETVLKTAGIIEFTEQERINAELDRLHPNARSKQLVLYEGKRYQIRYFPLQKSLSGKTVKEWDHEWQPVEEESFDA